MNPDGKLQIVDISKTPTNGDGFELGWYAERPEPGLHREIRPAWPGENLRSLCEQVRSPLFFVHVRASAGTATMRANCHPFGHGGTCSCITGRSATTTGSSAGYRS